MDENLIETAELLLQIEKQMKKIFNENNKLQKQTGLVTNVSPVFVKHCILKKQYVVTYVRAYDGVVNEVNIKEIASLVNPKIYDKGVFIISKYNSDQFFDHDHSGNIPSPLNSTTIHNNDETSLFYFTNSIQLPIQNTEYVKCGTIFSTSDIIAGGKKEFHGSLGLLKKVLISMKELGMVTVTDARYICAFYMQSVKLSKSIGDIGMLIVPCKDVKPLNLTAMLCYPEEKATRGDTALHIMEIHNDTSFKKYTNGSNEEVAFSSVYDILGDFRTETNEQESSDETSLVIEFHWNGCDSQLMQHPPHSAKTILQLQVTVGETRSAANDVFLELTALDGIFNSSQSNSTRLLSTSTLEVLHEKLRLFKECVSDYSFYGNAETSTKQDASEQTDDLETPMSQLIQQSFQRKDHDFTDKLWTFLRQPEVMEDLRGYLDDILTDIVDGTLQPAISPTNETKLAKYIRRMYLADNDEAKLHMKEKISEFLSSEQSIQGLVSEIGFEKLRKDYFNFFISKELASSANLQKLYKQNTPIDLSVIWKLHYCFEIVITPAIYLNLAQDCQSTLLKSAIEYYSNNNIGPCSPVFCLSLLPFHDSSSSVHQTCEARQPISWQRGYISSNKAGFKETNVLRISCKNVLPEDDNSEFIGTQQNIERLCEGVVTLPFRKIKNIV